MTGSPRGGGSVSKVIDDIPLVHPIDLVAEPGECIVVRGPNGSAKTTLLSMIAETPTRARTACRPRCRSWV